jgi:uncharacterized protein (DUF342 family)
MPQTPEPSIVIAPDASQAMLVVPPGLSPDALRPDALAELARQAGVEVDQPVQEALARFVAAYAPADSEVSAVIARAVPPTHGRDARIEWAPGMDPTVSHRLDSPTGRTDHYAGKTYVRLRSGDIVGTLHKPSNPVPGRDVRGKPIRANSGRPLPFRFHPTLQIDDDGRIVAKTDGVLTLERGEIRISQILEIPGSVDFSTGNIDFAGNIAIAGGVRAGFKVKAGGDLSIGGLIEAAELACTGNLSARTGMAGQGRGTLTVGGNAHAVYLENVRGAIRGDLDVDREIADCRLIVGGSLKSPAGTIMGGRIAVTAALVVKTVGSPGGVPTTIVLDDAPFVRAALHAARRALARDQAELDALAERERILRINPRLSAGDKERLDAVTARAGELRAALAAHHDRITELEIRLEAERTIDVLVSGIIHAGVTLHIADLCAEFTMSHKGPLWFFRDPQGQPAYRVGATGAARPLADIARITRPASGKPLPRPAA